MDESECETDGEASELAIFMTAVGDAKDDHQEHESEESLNEERAASAELEISVAGCCRKLRTIAVSCEDTGAAKFCRVPDNKKDLRGGRGGRRMSDMVGQILDLYEKCGFVRVGEEKVINENMTLIDYELNL